VPSEFQLSQNHPNPFNPETEIRFVLPKASHVEVKIYNTLGQEIRTLADSPYEAGYHSVIWDSKDNQGNYVASGVYLYELKAHEFVVKKMSLVR
jgi:flagellar hook assembly protein FlgD